MAVNEMMGIVFVDEEQKKNEEKEEGEGGKRIFEMFLMFHLSLLQSHHLFPVLNC